MSNQRTVFRSCTLCEAMCGLRIEIEDEKIVAIRGDKEDLFSRGHLCAKGPELKNIYESPDRIKHPMKRVGDTWKEISWVEALSETATKIHEIQSKHGQDSVAFYLGNPNVHNYGSILFNPRLAGKVNTKNVYVATSVDQLPHHFASYFMFGHQFLLPIPDIDRSNYFLIIGGNPFASNGSIMTAPDVKKRLKAIEERGGKFVVVDPRKTETASNASDHIFIRPGTDVYFLLAMLNVIFTKGLVKKSKALELSDGIEEIRSIVMEFPPEKVEAVTGISKDTIIQITQEFCAAEGATCYGRIGVSTQPFGAVCLWLIYVLNIITGNFDSPGGMMFTLPAVDMIGPDATESGKGSFDRYRSRVRRLPEFSGEFPVATMADEMLTPGEGQIKMLITSAGNPVLSTPNGKKLEKGLESLDFMVSIDFYLNETTKHANIILPPTSGLEHDHYDLIFNIFAVRNVTKYAEPVFQHEEGMLHDWEIFSDLAKRLDLVKAGKPLPDKLIESKIKPTDFIDRSLQSGPYGKSHGLSLEKLKQNPHGIDLGPMIPLLPERLRTKDKRIKLAPDILVKDIARVKKVFAELQTRQLNGKLLLIGRRHLRNNNSWMHNMPKLMTGAIRCTAMINPLDAEKLGIKNESQVKVKSRVGEVVVLAEVTDEIMQGVVSLPHGFGHNRAGTKLSIAPEHKGVSINDITDELEVDELSGNAAFSGTQVEVTPV
ncbi:MAG: molybdopterin-dependent oxidoreductase [Leptospiraceae bacterium]|nr:molybdopterin-dependent oxidoreductase [Leptospiraceae bacterium]